MRVFASVLLLLACTLASGAPGDAPTTGSAEVKDSPAIALKKIKFEAFIKDVKAEKGKVVAAYLWSSTSAPSKKNLPTLIALQQKHGKDGLIVLTVSNDTKGASKAALQHLESAKCALTNYVQDESDASDGWTSCFGCCGFPSLVIFGRDGKEAATFDVTELPFESATIEKTLVKLLDAK